MLGMNLLSLHCTDDMEAGELRLNKSVFYSGWVLTGCNDVSLQPDQGDESRAGRIDDEDPRASPDPKELLPSPT